jgi:hypothetical protein
VILDPSSAAAHAIFDAQYAMAYGSGQNTAYWFPTA